MTFDLKNAIEQTIGLQNKANSIMASPNWTEKGIDWVTCSLAELGEGVGWLGYKHWKKQEPNFHQAFIEIVDSYHFMLSLAIEKNVNAESLYHAAKNMQVCEKLIREFDSKEDVESKKTVGKKAFKALASSCLDAENDVYKIAQIVAEHLRAAAMIGFDAKAFFAGYVPKNTLNIFRQENGDREGKYPRIWKFEGQEIEDNQVVEILTKRDPSLAYDSVRLSQELSEHLVSA